MLSQTEKTLLKELLALAPVPEQTLSFSELMGFMFGLAITPEAIPEEEWMIAIFGDDDSGISAIDQARSMSTVLGQIYSTFIVREQQRTLHFPFQLETLEREELEEVLEWVSGLEEALALRPEFWEPSENSTLTAKKQEELFFSMMVIQGLVDPMEIQPFFEKLPDEVFSEAFTSFDQSVESRELQIQAFLLATLPLSVQTLQEHAERLKTTIPPEKQPAPDSILKPTPFPENNAAKKTVTVPGSGRRDNIIEVDFSRKKKLIKRPIIHALYQLKIGILKSKPPIWRRILVPGWATLADLHEIIQVSMGWFNEHLHHFDINDVQYGPIMEDMWGMDPVADEMDHTLSSLPLNEKFKFSYIYDFGDNWHHQITVEKIIEQDEDTDQLPMVVKGKRACPPENIGGIWGYQEFLEAYTDPTHDDHAAMVEWAGPDFRPELFNNDDIEDINQILFEMFL